ncbi:hypothetical protein [Brevibacillus sp. SYSU BS000544]|uniref:hypothetical protein n=1 Tax=Brevibacillus sp. SYSU BS000544 TaxID=3416443 RepID=UPI003CE4A31D
MRLIDFFSKRGYRKTIHSKNLSTKKRIPNSKFTPGFASLKHIVDESTLSESPKHKAVEK